MNEVKTPTKKTKKGLFKIVLLLVLAITLIILGVAITKMASPKNIIKKSIDQTYTSLKDVVLVEKQETSIGPTFTDKIDFSINMNGTIFNDLDEQSKKMIANIGKTQTNVVISQDLNKKELLIDANSTIDKSTLYQGKYLVKNSTGYYYMKSFKDSYINVGSNNYFENIKQENELLENYKYLLDKSFESFVNNINEDKVSQEQITTSIDDKEEKLLETSYIIDNKELIDVINKIKKDLQKDSKSKEIITNIDKDFFKTKLSVERKILQKDEFIKYNVYTDKLYNIKKIELVREINDKSSSISYEVLKDQSLIKVIKEEKLVNKYYIKNLNNKYQIIIEDNKSKEIGKIEIENSEKRTSINATSEDKDFKLDISFDRELSDIVKNKSYKSKNTLTINVTDLNTTEKYLVLNCALNSEINNKSEINEDTKNALIYEALTDEEKVKLKNVQTDTLNSLAK